MAEVLRYWPGRWEDKSDPKAAHEAQLLNLATDKAFGATKTPEAFLFDANGKLAYHGAIDDNSEDANAVKSHYLKDALEAVLSGKPVPMAETKALGCGIKFRS